MKIDWGLLLVICGAIASLTLVYFTGIWDMIYIAVACIVIDVFHKGIYQPLREKRKMSAHLREWKKHHTKENGF
jgi:hypothetical protein